MNKKQKKTLERILIAVALVIVLKLLPALPMPVELALYCIPYLVAVQGAEGHQEPPAL